jgi:hypothetical protein
MVQALVGRTFTDATTSTAATSTTSLAVALRPGSATTTIRPPRFFW